MALLHAVPIAWVGRRREHAHAGSPRVETALLAKCHIRRSCNFRTVTAASPRTLLTIEQAGVETAANGQSHIPASPGAITMVCRVTFAAGCRL